MALMGVDGERKTRGTATQTREPKKSTPTPPRRTQSVRTTYSAPRKSSGGGSKSSSKPKNSSKEEFRKKYSKQINNEIDRYEEQTENDLASLEKQIKDEIARMREQGKAAIGRNNEYLEQQLERLQEQKAQGDQQIINLQNRRGGFYSGGTDYYLAQNQRETQQATGNLQSEIAGRNAEIENSNNMAAEQALGKLTLSREQAMNKINMLREQAPDQVRQLVDQALERQYQRQMQERQFALQQQQAASAAAARAASAAAARRRLALQEQQQQFEQNLARDKFEWQKNQAQTQSSQDFAQNDLAERNAYFKQNQDQSSYNDFMMDLNRINSPEEGMQLISAYRDRGVSSDTVTQMIKDLNNRFGM